MTFSPWVQKRIKRITDRLTVSELELLELVATYKGKTLIEFVVEIVKMELNVYRKDLRFNRWRDQKHI